MAGNIADHDAQVFFTWGNESEIPTNGSHRLIERLDSAPTPDKTLWGETLLHARREDEVFFNFAMALLELNIRLTERIFRALLLADVRRGDDGVEGAVAILDLAGGDQHRHSPAAGLRQIKFILAMPLGLADLDVLFERRDIFGRLHIGEGAAQELFGGSADHALKYFVRKDDPGAGVIDDYALIEGFQDAGNFIEPLGLFERRIVHEVPPVER